MDIMQLCIFAGIAAGGIFVSILQVYLMKSVKGYRFVFVLPVIFCLIAVGLSIPDFSDVISVGFVNNASDGFIASADQNYDPRVFQIDWSITLAYFVPRLFFAVMPVITTLIIIMKKKRDIKL